MDRLISLQAALEHIVHMELFGRDFPVVPVNVLKALPSAQPYTEAEIQKIQELEQAELDKAFELGQQDAQPEQQWTLCDKMPDKPDVYLTVRVGYGVEQYEVLRYSPGVGFCRYSDEDGEYYSVPVHAWMSIEPWRGEEHE